MKSRDDQPSIGPLERTVQTLTRRRYFVLLFFIVFIGIMALGATNVGVTTDLGNFISDTPEADADDFISQNFGTDSEETTVQIVVRGNDTLAADSYIETLRLQQDLVTDPRVNGTFPENAFNDLASVVATTAIKEAKAADVRDRSVELENYVKKVEATAEELNASINEVRQLQLEYDELNLSYSQEEIGEDEYNKAVNRLEERIINIVPSSVELSPSQEITFNELLVDARHSQSNLFNLYQQYEAGKIHSDQFVSEEARIESALAEIYQAIESEVLIGEIHSIERQTTELESIEDDLRSGIDPSIDDQIEQLLSMNTSEVEAVTLTVLDENRPGRGAFVFLPVTYESGTAGSEARSIFVTQISDNPIDEGTGSAPQDIIDSQLVMSEVAGEHLENESFVIGVGLNSDEIDRSLTDTMMIIVPLALLLVVAVLMIAYRDPIDVLLGLIGIGAVLVGTFGLMGWLGIEFNQLLVAVLVLLIGLAIDYAIHVVMRYREQREAGVGKSDAMKASLLELFVPLTLVTTAAAIGFLSNAVSPIEPIQEFGIVSAAGIIFALITFGVFIPSLKLLLEDSNLIRYVPRTERPIGTEGRGLGNLLAVGNFKKRRWSWLVIILALLLTTGGLFAATQVPTEFNRLDFMADDPDDWTKDLPEPFAFGTYDVKQNIDYLNQKFVRGDSRGDILIKGNIESKGILHELERAEQRAEDSSVVVTLANGNPDVRSPLSEMKAVAYENTTFNETLNTHLSSESVHSTDNISALYDAFFEADYDRAHQVIHRNADGEYEAARLIVSVQGDAPSENVLDEMDAVNEKFDSNQYDATNAGPRVLFGILEYQLFQTVIQGLLITLVVVSILLGIAYRIVHSSATLGFVTVIPIVFGLTWVLGSMYVMDIAFNALTGTITGLTIGLGIAYNIHVSARFKQELDSGLSSRHAMENTLRGTGGALAGSASTTIAGFSVLLISIIPVLREFGLVTGLTIAYAFIGSMLVLPSLLSIWHRYLYRQ